MGGRIKTLHPKVHGGILALRDEEDHLRAMDRHDIERIDLVVVNLYPFEETIATPDVTRAEAVEQIDIGGPTLVRSAAKNHRFVAVVTEPSDYGRVLDDLQRLEGAVSTELRRELAVKAFGLTARYDAAISRWLFDQEQAEHLTEEAFPSTFSLAGTKTMDLRYGENPHQQAAFYRTDETRPGVATARQLQGKELSYNNLNDTDAAIELIAELDRPAVVIVKHANPCGVAVADSLDQAYALALRCDPVSAFGGIIAVNRPGTWDMTEAMRGKRYDIIIAPGYEDRALERLRKRKDLRILQTSSADRDYPDVEFRQLLGGMLAHEPDTARGADVDLSVVTKRAPTAAESDELRFAWNCVKHVKSNGVVIARERATIGIGGGQPNRLWPTQQAIERAGEQIKGAVIASDAFFPFAKGDAVEDACRAGITAIIQPGGGARDDEAIDVCNEYGVAMVFTGTRAFRH